MNRIYLGVLVVLLGMMSEAFASPGYVNAWGGSVDVTVDVAKPMEACAQVAGQATGDNAVGATYGSSGQFTNHAVCKLFKDGSGNRHVMYAQRYTSGTPGTYLSQIVVTREGGDPCFESWFASATGNTIYSAPGACPICPSPQEWNASTLQCEAPECPSGEIYDTDISACRPTCEADGEFYHYSSNACQAQCPVGKAYPNLVMTNKVIPQDMSFAVPTVNGCKVNYYYYCVPDIKVPAGLPGAGEGYWTGSDYTGKVCANWWEYSETIALNVVDQQEYEEATGASGFYDGDATVEDDVKGRDLASVPYNVEGVGGTPAELTEVHSLCSGGVQRLAITVDGVLNEAIFLGPCADVNQPLEPPGLSQDPAIAAVQEGIAQIQDKQEDQGGVLDAIQELATDIKGLTQTIAATVGADEENPEEPSTFEGPEVGEGYTTQYEDGLDGVVRDAQNDLETTGVQSWIDGLMPTLPSEVDACPSFELPPLPIFGTNPTFTPDCRIWDWIKAFLFVSTVALCYGVVLGRN